MEKNIYKWTKTQSIGIHFLNWIVKNILVIKLSGFSVIFIFITPAPVVTVIKDRHVTQHHHKYDDICDNLSLN